MKLLRTFSHATICEALPGRIREEGNRLRLTQEKSKEVKEERKEERWEQRCKEEGEARREGSPQSLRKQVI